MMGNLRVTLGKNSKTRLPPASVAIDVRKVRLTTLAVTLGCGIVGHDQGSGDCAARNSGIIELIIAVVPPANHCLAYGKEAATDEVAIGDPVIAWILVKGAGKNSIGEDPHAGGAQHGCAQLFAECSGIFTVLGVGIEELFVAGGVEGVEST